ncbi:cyanophycinase [Burkholderia sp. LMU1-1-1.1]
MIIGGGEDRTDNKEILARFVALAGGAARPLVVLTAASKIPERVWEMYRVALADLGAGNVRHVPIADRGDADDAALADIVAGASGIFMTGGDQKRLVACIGGTRVEQAMRAAFHGRGACIAGTSAGASAMCTHMLAEGKAELAPEKGAVRLGAGLGFVHRVVIDQHFSQRHRIHRLLSVVAQTPFLIGAGIDEDTALIVHGRSGIEVIGEGMVTVLDCRNARSNIADLPAGAVPTLVGVALHLLPSGAAFAAGPDLPAGTPRAPPELADFLNFLADRNNAP